MISDQPPDLAAYFGVARLADIIWAHAVNSRARLAAALVGTAMFLECDVLADDAGELVLAHNPGDPADLSLAELLAAMRGRAQGLKLDFKSPAAVAPALDALISAALRQPVILNADILTGPAGRPAIFDPAAFIAACRDRYPASLISPGWTTSAAGDGYSAAQIEEMLAVCAGLAAVTFPVRASLLPLNWPLPLRLLHHPGATFTLWDSAPLSPQLAASIRAAMPQGDYFFDCALA